MQKKTPWNRGTKIISQWSYKGQSRIIKKVGSSSVKSIDSVSRRKCIDFVSPISYAFLDRLHKLMKISNFSTALLNTYLKNYWIVRKRTYNVQHLTWKAQSMNNVLLFYRISIMVISTHWVWWWNDESTYCQKHLFKRWREDKINNKCGC